MYSRRRRRGRMKLKTAFLSLAFLIALSIAGCTDGDMSSPEGQYRGCFSHVTKMTAALDKKIRASGNLDDISGPDDVYWLIAKTEDQYNKLVEKAEMFCEDVSMDISPSSNSYKVSAHPVVAPYCEITGTPESIGPKNLVDCQ